jgi:hypothetical protein
MSLRSEELENEKRELIDNLYHLSPEVETAQELAISFIGMIRERQVERFDGSGANLMIMDNPRHDSTPFR